MTARVTITFMRNIAGTVLCICEHNRLMKHIEDRDAAPNVKK
jgi:hypothetical protein